MHYSGAFTDNFEQVFAAWDFCLVYFMTSLCLNQSKVYLFKVNYRNTRKRCEICSKLTITTPEPHH